MTKPSSFIEELHVLEQSIFKEFALETSKNIHVESVDLKNPLTSIYRILLCDIITSQMDSKEKEKALPKIIPVSIFIKDNDTNKCSYIRFGDAGLVDLKDRFEKIKRKETDADSAIKEFRELVLIKSNYFKFYSNENLNSWALEDVACNSILEGEFNCEKEIEFSNSDKDRYPDVSKDEIVNYSIKITYTIHGENSNTDGVNVFLTKISSLALHTKRNRRNYSEIEMLATKAAISDIINRNMAHHLSSHVSNRATLDIVLKRLGLTYSDLSLPENYYTILDLLNRFNQYRDERSEYLTYITHFASPISAFLYQDVIRPFIENTLLMDNIAANENIHYGGNCKDDLLINKLKIIVQREGENGRFENLYATYPVKSPAVGYNSENLPYFRKKTENGFEYETPVLTGGPDIEVSLPGSLGKHALYSILENFIRNSAKHGGKAKHNNLDIILQLSDLYDQDHITVTLTDNCSVVSDEKIVEFNNSIQTEILSKKDLGLIDMKVNACLLAGKELTDAVCKEAIQAVKTKEGILSYKFKISKPKKAVFIGECYREISNNNGFFYFTDTNEFRRSTVSKSFQFAILSDSIYNLPIKDNLVLFSELPARILKQSELPDSISNDNLLTTLYEVWLNKLRGSDNLKGQINLFFEQDDIDKPTTDFKNTYSSNSSAIKVFSNEDLKGISSIEGDKNVLFDRHGGLIKKFSQSLVSTNNSWILIDKNNSDFDYITRFDIENHANLLALELEEAGLLKVLIIDERVAEQSVRDLSNDKVAEYIFSSKYGFEKFNLDKSKFTLFDTAWAANVFFATHLNNVPLKMEIDLESEHKLNVSFDGDNISYQTNITSLYAEYRDGRWGFLEDISSPRATTLNFNPDILIIHRTKLKELIAMDANVVSKIAEKGINLIVTTGSGTTHGINGDFKILPYSSLSEMILGKRIQKLKFSKLLLQLTKNKI